MKHSGVHISEGAVSEAIGFVLILGIIITGIGMVTLYGYPVLVQQQNAANVKNMEKVMIVLQTDLNNIAYKTVPYQETTIQISGGTLSVVNPGATSPHFIISNSTKIFKDFQPGELTYQAESETAVISLMNGAVVKRYPGLTEGGQSTILSHPRWFYDYDEISGIRTLVIPLINISYGSTGNMESKTSSVSLVKMRLNNSATTMVYSNPGTIIINYSVSTGEENLYGVAWKNYLTGSDMEMILSNEKVFSSEFENSTSKPVNYLVIKEYDIQILGL